MHTCTHVCKHAYMHTYAYMRTHKHWFWQIGSWVAAGRCTGWLLALLTLSRWLPAFIPSFRMQGVRMHACQVLWDAYIHTHTFTCIYIYIYIISIYMHISARQHTFFVWMLVAYVMKVHCKVHYEHTACIVCVYTLHKIYIYIYMCVYIYKYVYIYIYIYIYHKIDRQDNYIWIKLHSHTNTNTHIHTYTHTKYTHTQNCLCMICEHMQYLQNHSGSRGE